MKKIEPQQDFLLVEVVEEEKKHIIAPVSDEPELYMFRVLAVGPGRFGVGGVFITPRVNVGDVVVLSDRGAWVEIEPPKVKVETGFKKSGGKLLISWDSVVAKVTEIQDDDAS